MKKHCSTKKVSLILCWQFPTNIIIIVSELHQPEWQVPRRLQRDRICRNLHQRNWVRGQREIRRNQTAVRYSERKENHWWVVYQQFIIFFIGSSDIYITCVSRMGKLFVSNWSTLLTVLFVIGRTCISLTWSRFKYW